jgi:hypothetical protein
MDVSEFEDLIDRLGEDMSRWPVGQRLAAEKLIASCSEARELLDRARALRQGLTAPPVRAPAGLVDRIVAAAGPLSPLPPFVRSSDLQALRLLLRQLIRTRTSPPFVCWRGNLSSHHARCVRDVEAIAAHSGFMA